MEKSEGVTQEMIEATGVVQPIEHGQQDPTREYIPLAGWEVQTKGKGSSYRLADVKNDDGRVG